MNLHPLHIPSQTRVLANGMRIVTHEDRSSPVVAVHLMYHVGSKNERPGRTGLAHLLEHLMFEGSEHCPKGEFDTLLEAAGGSNNGSTWLDRTNYYETVPSHATELALWLEHDRMAHFLPVLGGEMLEIQRDVVINERRQSCENRPYGLADERLHELLFPSEHPYSWPTIGYTADLESIVLTDVRTFFQTYYTPGNATLVLAGDLRPDNAFDLAERYFADLAPGPPLPPAAVRETNGSEPAGRRRIMEDRVSFPRIYRAAAVPAYGTPDWIALDVLAYLLADGESSRLQHALVRTRQLALDVDTYLYPAELHGIFGITATARAGVEPGTLEDALDQTIGDLVRNGVEASEVAGAVRRVRRDQVADFASIEARAEALAYAATVLGAADELESVMQRYVEVTPDDVVRVARDYLAPDRQATVVVIPAMEPTRAG